MLSQLMGGLDLTGISLMLILSFFLSYSVDLIMHRYGFGIFGNMMVMNAQFIVAFYYSKKYFTGTFTLNQHLLMALGVSFATILILGFFKARVTKA